MASYRTLRSFHLYRHLRPQSTSTLVRKPLYTSSTAHSSLSDFQKSCPCFNSFKFSSITRRTISASAHVEERSETESTDSESDESTKKSESIRRKIECVTKLEKEKKPLDVFFKEAVGLSENPKESDSSEAEELEDDEFSDGSELKEIEELKKKLRKLENEVRSLKRSSKEKAKKKKSPKKEIGPPPNDNKARSLYSLFANDRTSIHLETAEVKRHPNKELSSEARPPRKELSQQVKPPQKELSPDMVLLVGRLYEEGYLNKANFLPEKKLDLSCFSSSYSRSFLVSAAKMFGGNHQEIAKCLSVGDLKTVALFGCPSLARDTVFAAKRLRTFFGIYEDMLEVPRETKTSIRRLLNEVINLNQ
ncbi:PREDICTED: uncharacterized protein LOC104591288 isoform X2 [Nelumbo nucifera]|uniref:Uncharacterized protein LOC104591288 isoform X2 n=2 Tax=Nelumbo nucifera TaxID=4432 RepID=A0A1U7ZKL0_NELNU|nr:PREDICTED: uncharacterized protein LOC104591288 isoform X2 [Nelumbo nucifera]DAD48178.1 TPA_asm: hypothetical protein HUJ06_018115 [Nelumbo nucifera]